MAAVDNMKSGITLFHITDKIRNWKPIRTVRLPKKGDYIRNFVFCEEGKLVACGGGYGQVYVFDVETGNLVQFLQHADSDGLIAAVAVCVRFYCILYDISFN